MKTLPSDGVSADIENLDSLNDEALARLAQNGSNDAEHTLVVRFMPLVRIKARPYFLIGADHSLFRKVQSVCSARFVIMTAKSIQASEPMQRFV